MSKDTDSLIKLSNHLDSIGLNKEADYLDYVIRKEAQVHGEGHQNWLRFWRQFGGSKTRMLEGEGELEYQERIRMMRQTSDEEKNLERQMKKSLGWLDLRALRELESCLGDVSKNMMARQKEEAALLPEERQQEEGADTDTDTDTDADTERANGM